jgi:hypothetical protein
VVLNLFSKDNHVFGGFDPQANLPSLASQHRQDDAFANVNPLAFLAAEHQHDDSFRLSQATTIVCHAFAAPAVTLGLTLEPEGAAKACHPRSWSLKKHIHYKSRHQFGSSFSDCLIRFRASADRPLPGAVSVSSLADK